MIGKASGWISAAKGFLNIAIFVAMLALACLGIHALLPVAPVSMVQAKLEHLKEHIGDYDTLFIGSSRIYHQIIPSLFDRLTAERGMKTSSFNAAVDGMRPPEDAYFFDEIRRYKPPHLRWVFIELGAVRVPLDPAKRGTNRIVYWHDWERLALIFQQATDVKKSRHLYGTLKSLREPMGDFCEHLGLFFENMGNLGRASYFVEHLIHPTWPWVWTPPLGPTKDGFVEIDRTQMSDTDRQTYEKMVTARRAHPAGVDYSSPASQDALQRLMRRIEALGATPVLIIPPTTAGKNFRPQPGPGKEPIILDYSDMDQYPALFDEKNRLDTDHLNTAGAEVFTHLVVDQFTQAVNSRH